MAGSERQIGGESKVTIIELALQHPVRLDTGRSGRRPRGGRLRRPGRSRSVARGRMQAARDSAHRRAAGRHLRLLL